MTQPPPLQARLLVAMRLHVQGRADAAYAEYEALLRDYPKQSDILHGLGVISMQRQDWARAVEHFSRAAASHPAQPRHLLPLAKCLAQSGERERAMQALAETLKADPLHQEAAELLEQLCLADPPPAGKSYAPLERLIAAHPEVRALRLIAVRVYQSAGAPALCLPHLEKLHRAGVRSEAFYKQYGVILRDTGQYKHCLALCDEALAAFPASTDMLKLRSGIHLALSQYDAALADMARNVALAPQDSHALTAVGIIKLLISEGREGFEEFSAHRDHEIGKRGLEFALPEWQGERLAGKHLLLWGSQGVGDIIMFASFLPWVLAEGARVTLALYPKLIPLFERSFPGIRLVLYSRETATRYAGECDFHSIVGQLMRYAMPSYIPAQHPPFLKADMARAQALRDNYFAACGEKKLIGISWHTTNPETFAMRNIALAQWRPLFSLQGVQCISLQYGNHAAEIDSVNRDYPGAVYADPDTDAFADMDGLAAQIAAMDEVITIDNTTVHLSGALGVDTTLLLNAASDWRWGLKSNASRWYKSVTFERQAKILQWKPVMQRIGARLAAQTQPHSKRTMP